MRLTLNIFDSHLFVVETEQKNEQALKLYKKFIHSRKTLQIMMMIMIMIKYSYS